MKLFFIPKGTLLFRTSTSDNTIPEKPTFYALELDDAKIYLDPVYYEKGKQKRLNIIKVTKNIYLIDMRYISVLKSILNGFKVHKIQNQLVIDAIKNSFFSGIDENTTDEIVRQSIFDRDRIYTNELCILLEDIKRLLDIKSEYNVVGYIFPKTKNWDGNNFHSEIIICNPPSCLEISQLNIERNMDIINRNSLDKTSKQKLTVIPNQLQNQIEKMEYSNVNSKEFESIYENSLQIRTEIVSKSSAFSIILKSIYIDTINTKKWSVIKKIPKYKYTENCIEFKKRNEKCPDEKKYTKFYMDSLIIEFLNGLFINKLIDSKDILLKVIFVTTYCLLFVDIHEFYNTQNKYRTRQYNFLKQMQTTNDIKYSYFDLQSLNMSKILVDKDKDLEDIYKEPTLLCKYYEESLMPILYQQDANTNISVYRYMKMEKILKKDKLIELIKITYMIYKALYTINIESPFTHNDLHLNNVLLDDSFRLLDDVVTNVWTPRIIDYGRGSTVYSERFFEILESKNRDSYIDYCNRSRTFRFKNNFTISMDLLFIYQIYLNREDIDTRTSNREIMKIKSDFFKILEELPQGEYFEYNQKNQIRLSYEEWINIMKGKFKLKGIKSIEDIFREIRNLIMKYPSIFNSKP